MATTMFFLTVGGPPHDDPTPYTTYPFYLHLTLAAWILGRDSYVFSGDVSASIAPGNSTVGPVIGPVAGLTTFEVTLTVTSTHTRPDGSTYDEVFGPQTRSVTTPEYVELNIEYVELELVRRRKDDVDLEIPYPDRPGNDTAYEPVQYRVREVGEDNGPWTTINISTTSMQVGGAPGEGNVKGTVYPGDPIHFNIPNIDPTKSYIVETRYTNSQGISYGTPFSIPDIFTEGGMGMGGLSGSVTGAADGEGGGPAGGPEGEPPPPSSSNVTFTPNDPSLPTVTVSVDDSGNYDSGPLAPGTYMVRVEGCSDSDGSGNVSVRSYIRVRESVKAAERAKTEFVY